MTKNVRALLAKAQTQAATKRVVDAHKPSKVPTQKEITDSMRGVIRAIGKKRR